MNHSIRSFLAWLCAGLAAGGAACGTAPVAARPTAPEGQQIFRFDTFGNEVFWTDTLRMHEVIEGAEPTTLQDTAVHGVLRPWGAGKYDARWNHDGKNDPVVIPPAYGLAGTKLATATGEGTKYRTTPLRGLWQHPPYFHDRSAATLEAVVDHYIRVQGLSLTSQQRTDLVQFLRSL